MPDAAAPPRNCFIDSLMRRAVELDREGKHELSRAFLDVARLALKCQRLDVGDRLIGVDAGAETFIGYPGEE